MKNNEIESLVIWAVSPQYYVTKLKNCLYVYDYNHQLIHTTKPIKNIVWTRFSKTNNILYFWVGFRQFIYCWDFINNTLHKIKYSKLKYIHMNSATTVENKLILHCDGVENEKHINKMITIYEDTDQISEYLLDDMISCQKILPIKNELFIIEQKEQSRLEIVKLINQDISHIHTIENVKSQATYCISNNMQWSFLASINEETNIAELRIYDFHSLKQIDQFQFYHVGFYRMKIGFFEFQNQYYILYQAHPVHYKNEQYLSYQKFDYNHLQDFLKKMEDFDDLLGKEKWHTYVYSLNERKIVKEFDYEIYIYDVSQKDLLVIQESRHGKHKMKTKFYYG